MKYTKLLHNDTKNYHQSGSGSTGSSNSTNKGRISMSLTSSSSSKRSKKHNWGTRERTGMSFLIVIAFFAVFGLIILTELFMIDERAHGGMMSSRTGSNYGGRYGDSMPDYDTVKADYDLLDAGLLNDNKLGFVQFHDNKFKIQDADSNNDGTGRLSGVLLNSQSGGDAYAGAGIGGGTGLGSQVAGGNGPLIPWGKMLHSKLEETLPPFPIGIEPTDGSWQIVNGTRFKFFVFSAYYDRRYGTKSVRVVGATKTRGPERVWCRFWYPPAKNASAAASSTASSSNERKRFTSVTLMARVKIIRENWSLKYSACFILCPVRPQEYGVPEYVSIVARLRTPPGNLLKLRNTDWDSDVLRTVQVDSKTVNQSIDGDKPIMPPPPMTIAKFPTGDEINDNIAICVKPFHFNYDQSLFLMEYLEFYALLGVSHFTFYNHTIGPHATCILEHYINGDIPGNSTAQDEIPGKVEKDTPPDSVPPPTILKSLNYHKPTIEILPWNLRMRSQKEIRTEGLFAALNDCLYRNMYRYKYLALVDLDEFIVPRNVDTLNELLNSLNSRVNSPNTGAYSFQNGFFYLQFADDPMLAQRLNGESMELAQLRAALVTQRKIRRRMKLHPQKQRSKYICRPEAVVEAGNHFVWEYSPHKGALNVPPTDAILQHYRVCEFGGNDCIKAPSTVDRTATKYVNRLVERVHTVYRHLKTKCQLPELPPLPKVPAPKPEMKPIIRKEAFAKFKRSEDKIKSKDEHKKDIKKDNEIGESGVKKLTRSAQLSTTIYNTNDKQQQQSNNIKTNKTTTIQTSLTHRGNATITNNSSNSSIAVLATSTTPLSTTTITSSTTTTATTKDMALLRKKSHKVVVFFVDDKGIPRARLEYH